LDFQLLRGKVAFSPPKECRVEWERENYATTWRFPRDFPEFLELIRRFLRFV
jgi:hypothetical protein